MARLALPIAVAIVAGLGALTLLGQGPDVSLGTDSDFCSSCHTLDGPSEDLALSRHEQLECVECHEPSVGDRAEHVLAAVVGATISLDPGHGDEARTCRSCHFEEASDSLAFVANRAGHRIHFESDRSELEELTCSDCHLPEVHDLTPREEGCLASGCHQDQTVSMAVMSHTVMSCTDCHAWSGVEQAGAPAGAMPRDEADLLRPAVQQCLSCHAMSAITDVPEHDPHEGQCASCHLTHEHTSAADAAGTCATAGCHQSLDSLSASHVGLDPGVASDCASCHEAHEFAASGNDCRSCHEDLFREASVAAALPQPGAIPLLGAGFATLARAAHTPPDDPFRHIEHEAVECSSCHEGADGTSHGRLTVVTASDCRSCHHTERAGVECAACHEDVDELALSRSVPFNLTVGNGVPDRLLPFEHGPHAVEQCATCHTEDLTLRSNATDCQSCHEEHHEPDVKCISCHVEAPPEEHPAEVHITCTGSGCHVDPPIRPTPRSAELCIGCHQEEWDHKPGRACVDCHLLPDPGTPWVGHRGIRR